MFRMKLGLASAFRSFGVILLIAGLGMLFAAPAAADDDPIVGGEGPTPLVPFFCENCTPQYQTDCRSANGCYCFTFPALACTVLTPTTCYCP